MVTAAGEMADMTGATKPSWRLLPVDDAQRQHADSALPFEMIAAGSEALERCRDDLQSYVAGETIDWDDGMIAVAVYRGMVAAAPEPELVGDPSPAGRVPDDEGYRAALDACRAFVEACGGNPPDWLKDEFALAESALAQAADGAFRIAGTGATV